MLVGFWGVMRVVILVRLSVLLVGGRERVCLRERKIESAFEIVLHLFSFASREGIAGWLGFDEYFKSSCLHENFR